MKRYKITLKETSKQKELYACRVNGVDMLSDSKVVFINGDLPDLDMDFVETVSVDREDIITQRLVVEQIWYETEYTKNGWDTHGWYFTETGSPVEGHGWNIVEILYSDKFGNPRLGIAEKQYKY